MAENILARIKKLQAEAKVVLTNALPYIIGLAMALQWVVDQGYLDAWPGAIRWLILVIGALTGAIAFIRTVTKVDKSERGLLPKSDEALKP